MNVSQRPGLNDPIRLLNGVGSSLEAKLNKVGIKQIQDLLFHLPYRYVDRTRLTPMGSLRPGFDAQIQGEIELTQIKFGKRRSLLCRISDGTGSVVLRFFYFSKSQQDGLKNGATIRCYGQVRRGPNSLEIIHPEYQLITQYNEVLDEELTPIYPATEGLQQTRLRKLSDQAIRLLSKHPDELIELLPDDILNQLNMPTLIDALQYVHRPPPDANTQLLSEYHHPAQQRLAFEEMLTQQINLLSLRETLRKEAAHPFKADKKLTPQFLQRLGFDLTQAQTNAAKTIEQDLSRNQSMLRLVQGDVGCGKTVVAALAALQVIAGNYQVALMAPTELLAEQHYRNFCSWFEPLGIEVLYLSGKLKKSKRSEVEVRLKDDKPFMLIGTHALFQESIRIAKLGLVIVDEQHRFGVHQRLSLLEKGRKQGELPHQLIMTATPIPRTLTMAAYADLDHTLIKELPPNRRAVTTTVISNDRRDDIIERIAHVCASGRQVYWVCTLIDESETLQCETAINTAETLGQKLTSVKVGLIHGRMKADEKDAIMQDFKQGGIQLLVATTVIEVGVDVPNASLMVIENPERLGLSQLHQLRGRVGRGEYQSHCVLMYQSPLGTLAKERLEIMRTSNDGFVIAEKDLELRGPGEVLGTRQAGIPAMRVADMMRDAHLLPKIQTTAKIIKDKYPDKIKLLNQRWLGDKVDYNNV